MQHVGKFREWVLKSFVCRTTVLMGHNSPVTYPTFGAALLKNNDAGVKMETQAGLDFCLLNPLIKCKKIFL